MWGVGAVARAPDLLTTLGMSVERFCCCCCCCCCSLLLCVPDLSLG